MYVCMYVCVYVCIYVRTWRFLLVWKYDEKSYKLFKSHKNGFWAKASDGTYMGHTENSEIFYQSCVPVICIYPENKNSKQATLYGINEDMVATKKSAAPYVNGCWPCHHRSTCYEAGRSARSLHKSLKFECLQIGAISLSPNGKSWQ